ncbi:hypothetical protein [Aureispira anguillae]|uniref:Uncharacterized protein n=1 Tax=Aureispira anguillae TaxID=2864201 RepID=A0A916DUU9_9BACT|nr:hypothetical protein [Aureispira anguillae]BDS13047.1 hypothetical protein AsAng_0037750 [Aureispira anguillae]
MKKTESSLLGGGIVTLFIFAYGLKANRGWKYWVFSMIFIAGAGYRIGYALGEDDPEQKPASSDALEVIERNL